MRIDSHQHFWHYDAARDSWITEEMSVLKRDYLPDDLIPQLRANGMDGCIAVQADQSEAETAFLLELASRHEEILGVVGWMDLTSPEVHERLRYFSQFPKLRGFRHILQAEADDRFMMRHDFLRGIQALNRHNLTYDILIYARHLPVVAEFVRQFPEHRFVLDHIGKPAINAGQLQPWAGHIRALARYPNVYCKISGLVTEADWRKWSESDFRPYLDVVFESFGVDRLMFGSDWPVCLLAADYGRVKDTIENYARDLSAREKEQLFGLNAARFYGLAAAG
jgi:L-fuconolactonase